MGKGFSVKRGILEAKGKYVIFLDSDLSTPIDETDKLLETLSCGYDIAIGSRYIEDSDVRIKQPWYRQLMARVFNIFVQTIAISGIKDTQCGFKGFTKESVFGHSSFGCFFSF